MDGIGVSAETPASLMILGISSSNKRCHGPIWVLPSGGDRGATLSGQPIVDYQVRVTSRVASVGPNESIVAMPPVFHATVRLGQTTAVTNRAGVAIMTAGHRGNLTVTAGNTLKPTSVTISK